jgi:hypothetical protein
VELRCLAVLADSVHLLAEVRPALVVGLELLGLVHNCGAEQVDELLRVDDALVRAE